MIYTYGLFFSRLRHVLLCISHEEMGSPPSHSQGIIMLQGTTIHYHIIAIALPYPYPKQVLRQSMDVLSSLLHFGCIIPLYQVYQEHWFRPPLLPYQMLYTSIVQSQVRITILPSVVVYDYFRQRSDKGWRVWVSQSYRNACVPFSVDYCIINWWGWSRYEAVHKCAPFEEGIFEDVILAALHPCIKTYL